MEGCASASFGVSAKIGPEIRNSDNVSAARFFISSLFGTKFKNLPVSMQTTPSQKVMAASYNYVNRVSISRNKQRRGIHEKTITYRSVGIFRLFNDNNRQPTHALNYPSSRC